MVHRACDDGRRCKVGGRAGYGGYGGGELVGGGGCGCRLVFVASAEAGRRLDGGGEASRVLTKCSGAAGNRGARSGRGTGGGRVATGGGRALAGEAHGGPCCFPSVATGGRPVVPRSDLLLLRLQMNHARGGRIGNTEAVVVGGFYVGVTGGVTGGFTGGGVVRRSARGMWPDDVGR